MEGDEESCAVVCNPAVGHATVESWSLLPLCRACDDKGGRQVKMDEKRTKRQSKQAAAGKKKAATAAARASLATAAVNSGGTALSADSASPLESASAAKGEE